MFDEILFPTDGSEGADAVLDHVLDIARAHGATVHCLYVADTTRDSVTRIGGEVIDVLEREGETIVAETASRASERNVSTVTEVQQGEVSATITEYAETRGIDLVVMPTHGRTGLERFLLGSVTERVVRRARVPVLTVHPDEDAVFPPEDVLVPTDGSACADAALELGVDVATGYGATLHLLTVVDVLSLGIDGYTQMQIEVLEEAADRVISEARTVAADASVESVVSEVAFGSSIPDEIRSYVAEAGVDLVVVGTHGRTGVERYLLGSVTEKLVRTADVPVLTVPGPRDGD